MATIVNARDVLLQAASSRYVPVSQGSIDWANVTGTGRPSDYADVTQGALQAGVQLTAGGLTLSSGGSIKGGQTAYNLGTGFFIGYSGGTYKFSVGNSAGQGMAWDGTSLQLRGNLDFGYVQNGPPANADNTLNMFNAGFTTSGQITLTTNGHIKAGQSNYNTGTGFFLGWSTNAYKFSIGNSASHGLTWDGSALTIKGNFTAGTINIGSGAFQVNSSGLVTTSGISISVASFGNLWNPSVPAISAGVTSSSTQPAVRATGAAGNAIEAVGNVTVSGLMRAGGVSANTDAAVVGYSSSLLHGGRFHHSSGRAAFIASGSAGFPYDVYSDGNGTTIGPFTGAHDALIPKSASAPQVGDILVDVACLRHATISSTLFEVALSTTPEQKAVIGVAVSIPVPLKDFAPAALREWIEKPDEANAYESAITSDFYSLKGTHNYLAVNAVGEGQINVCGENGDIEAGDLIVTSSLPGKGMKQADNVIRGYTVAKARETVTFTGPTEVKQIACIYLAG